MQNAKKIISKIKFSKTEGEESQEKTEENIEAQPKEQKDNEETVEETIEENNEEVVDEVDQSELYENEDNLQEEMYPEDDGNMENLFPDEHPEIIYEEEEEEIEGDVGNIEAVDRWTTEEGQHEDNNEQQGGEDELEGWEWTNEEQYGGRQS